MHFCVYIYVCVYEGVHLSLFVHMISMHKQSFMFMLILAFHPALDWAAWLCPSSTGDKSPAPPSTLEWLRQLDSTGDQCRGNSLIMARINDEKFGVIQ